jgi:hypothetical protein
LKALRRFQYTLTYYTTLDRFVCSILFPVLLSAR